MLYLLKANANNVSRGQKIFNNCSRIICCDSPTLPLNRFKKLKTQQSPAHRKFFEIIDFGNGLSNFALVIGCNPARGAKNTLDDTNLHIAQNLFKSNAFGRYILVNLFTVLTPSVELLERYTKHNLGDPDNNFVRVIASLLNNFAFHSVYICWGPKLKNSSLLAPMVRSQIQSINLANSNFYYSVDASNNFVHPCKGKLAGFMPLLSWNTVI